MATPLETSLFSGVALQPFNLEPKESCAVRWTRWLSRFKTLLLAGDIKDPTKKRAILLIYGGGGGEVHYVFSTLSDIGEDKDFDKALTTLNSYFLPKSKKKYQVFRFRGISQVSDTNFTGN